MQLRVIDLFSGIGGFSYALHSIAKTVAYCEINEQCRKVLEKNMRTGTLHRAPIFTDVKTLTGNEIARLKPTMITGGFPCQDISVANPFGQGIEGARSGLYKEILRLVDECKSINVVFLENSSHIVNNGFDVIAKEFEKRGFKVKYTLMKASDVGAYHKRLRWYCLCFKDGIGNGNMPVIKDSLLSYQWKNWNLYKHKTVVKPENKTKKAKLEARCQMLGNSIVPQACMHAWNTIVKKAAETQVFVEAAPLKKSRRLRLTFTDGTNVIVKGAWATPTHSIWHTYSLLTDRGSRLVSNQAFYYTGMRIANKKQHYREYITNPQFVECLMGYPKDWTTFSGSATQEPAAFRCQTT